MHATPPEMTPEPYPPNQITLGDLIAMCRRSWKAVVVGAVVVGTMVLLAMLFIVPPQYEASAVLVVVQPTFSSELEPATLTVQGYQRLLESDAVIAETTRRLTGDGVLGPSASLRLGAEIHSRIFVSSRSEENELAPMIEATSRWSDAETAAEITNTWSAVFLEQVRQLMGGTTSTTVQFVDAQYRLAKSDLTTLEEQRLDIDRSFFIESDTTSREWDQKILRHETESEELISTYSAETTALVENLKADLNLTTRAAQLTALRRAYEDLQDEQAKVESQLALNQLRLESAQKQLETTSETLKLQRGITDDAVWATIVSSATDATKLDSVFDQRLIAEELNPVYINLSTRASQLELEVRALEPRAEQLRNRLATMTEDIRSLDTGLSADLAAVEKLTQERSAGIKNLKRARTLGLEHLQQEKERALDLLEKRWETDVVQIEREITQQENLFSELAANFNEASLAKADPGAEDIRIGAPAVPPTRPNASHAILRSALAALVGGFLGFVFAIVRDSDPRE